MRRLLIPIIAIVLCAATPVLAGKIGFVNAEEAIGMVDEGKAEFDKLRQWQDPLQAELNRLRDRVMRLREQLAQAQGSDESTPESIQAIERNEIEALRAFEDARRDYERELAEKRDEFLSVIATKIGAVGTEYAKANDFDAVFLLTAQPMVYVSEAADITEEVVAAYNARYPVSGQ